MCLVLFGCVYSILTIVCYLMPNPFYTSMLNIYDLVWFYGLSTIVGYLMPNTLYIYIKYIGFGLVGLWHINHCKLFNVKSFFNIYIKYI